MSPLAWGRGLKLLKLMPLCLLVWVAPRVGAWIETSRYLQQPSDVKSPLAWGRGLKLADKALSDVDPKSPLAWGRGLKL